MSNKAAAMSATNLKPNESLILGLGDIFWIMNIFELKNILAIIDLYTSIHISTHCPHPLFSGPIWLAQGHLLHWKNELDTERKIQKLLSIHG